MSITPASNTLLHYEASSEVGAAASDVYRLIADYRAGHPRIIPPKFFRNIEVKEGGYGDGTFIHFEMIAFGKTYPARARVTEPQPGRVLVETDPDKGAVTTFSVDPLGAKRSRVTIATDLPTRAGVMGRIERAIMRRYLRRAYEAELAQIDEQARIGWS